MIKEFIRDKMWEIKNQKRIYFKRLFWEIKRVGLRQIKDLLK
jgi:hypothetical protein